MNPLTTDKIEKLASRKGVKKVAVENFLGTLWDSTSWSAFANLDADARSYKWNAATVKAIRDGINLAFKG